MATSPRPWRVCLWMVCLMPGLAAWPAAPPSCRKVTLAGEVSAGHEWRQPIGQGWVFRLLPIQPDPRSGHSYSGWDLVVDRDPPAGFPDALLVATPPYNSMNEREIGATFGLRAQDAVGWNPRSFHFLVDPRALRESQKLYRILGSIRHPVQAPAVNSREAAAIQRQLQINQHAAAGQFRILDAGLAPGIADAAPYAENWAMAAARMPHSGEPPASGRPTPLGELHWIRFSITLWLPGGWRLPRALRAVPAPCPE